MNEINFLPESFFRQRARRRRIAIESVVVLAAVGVMGLWFHHARVEIDARQRHAAELETRGTQARRQVEQVGRLHADYIALARQLRVKREVALPVGHTQVLATIARLAPPTIAVTELTVQGQRPTPAAKAGAEPKAPRAQVKNAAPKPPQLTIDIAGLSPDDATIADLVGRLSEHALFEDVTMDYSRSTIVDGLIARRFRVTMKVPLDRDYRVVAAPTQGVADAN